MEFGTIAGSVDLGAGADGFTITAGRIVGNVQQGAGRDDFRMSGGEIASLNQGDNIDSFTISAAGSSTPSTTATARR